MESLLTHAPQPGDPADSIGRQLQRLVPALLRRDGRLEIAEDHGLQMLLPTALKKLYELRSRLAHGGLTPGEELPSGLSGLIDYDHASGLTRGIVKALLRVALAEPELVADLKGPARS